MKSEHARDRHFCRATGQRGQTILFVLLVLGLFLLGAIGFAVDGGNLWFHRQAAQNAADAACTAGAMDLYVNAQGSSMGGFPAGSPPAAFDCSTASGSAPCKYAALNGYNGTGLMSNTPSNKVAVTFPGSVAGVTTPPSEIAPTPFLQVNVVDRTKVFFFGLLSGAQTTDVGAVAACGLLQARSPIPIIVLNPTCPHAFQLSGNPVVKIVGGPSRSVQVNSRNTSCAAATTNAAGGCNSTGPTIDLSAGGPTFSGSSFGVLGMPATAPPGFTGAGWSQPAPLIGDPYTLVSAPSVPTIIDPAPTFEPYGGAHGCPDHDGSNKGPLDSTGGCVEYHPGKYTQPIVVKGYTAIFEPGIYYLTGTSTENCGSPGTGCVTSPTGQCRYGLVVNSNGVVRPSTAPGDGSLGTMFYFSGGGAGSYGSVFFGSSAGNSGGRNIDPYLTSGALCPGATISLPPQLNISSSVNGNVLLGQCVSKGFYIGAGSTDTAGSVRGILFFQDRANADTNGQASMQGGGGLVLSGNMYFHNCNSSGTGTNCPWPPTGAYKAFFQLQGTPGGATYVLGNITADELVLAGNGNISMLLNPNAVYNVIKVSLLR